MIRHSRPLDFFRCFNVHSRLFPHDQPRLGFGSGGKNAWPYALRFMRDVVLCVVVLLGCVFLVPPSPVAAAESVGSSVPRLQGVDGVVSSPAFPAGDRTKRIAFVASPDARMASAVAEFAQPLIDRGEVVGLGIGLVVGDRDWCCGLGTTRRAGGRPIAFDSVFEIGSVTKLFTALLMAFLVEDGRLLPSTSLGHCLPGIGTWADPRLPMIPLEQLVSHRSGLPRLPTNIDLSGPNPYADYSSTLLYQYLEIATLATDQGQAYVYSNLGTGLLGHVIEKTASSSLVELWHDRVFAPLSMKDTGIALNASWSSRLVQGYFRDDAGSLTPMIPWAWGELGGAGNLRSTVPDLLQFVRKVIAPGTDPLGLALQRMLRTWFPTGISGLEIGWGWHASATPFGRVIWHNGGTYGFQSFVGIVPERRLAVIILANTFSLSPTIDQLGMSLLRRLSSGPRSPIHQEKR